MSSVAPDNVEQVRERVLKSAREIEEISRSNLPPQAFLPKFLHLLLSALNARAGAVWLVGPNGQLILNCEARLHETGFQKNPQSARLNQTILGKALATGEASVLGADEGAELPTEHVQLLGPLMSENRAIGIVQLFLRPEIPREARPGCLQFLEQMTGHASRFLGQKRGVASQETTSKFWEELEGFTLLLHRSLDLHEVAAVAVNDGRQLLRVDRVSLAMLKGRKTSIIAVSGQDSVNSRSNLVRAMSRLAAQVISIREPLLFNGAVDDLAPQIEVPLAEFVQTSGSRMAMLLPLFESESLQLPEEKPSKRKKISRRLKAIGCLIIEQVTESQPVAGLAEKAEVVGDHVGSALFNARAMRRIFLRRLWRSIGQGLEWFHGRRLAKTTAILFLISVVTLVLAFFPWDYRVEGTGRLMPVVQREVFAPADGEIEEIFTASGRRVQKGTPLLRLRNDELEGELKSVKNSLLEKQQLELTLRAQLDSAGRDPDRRKDEVEVQGRLVGAQIEIRGLEEQLLLLERRISELTVRSPIDGTVATFQLEKTLRNRPVKTGEVLLQVMDDAGDWRLELEVEEHRMGHVLRAREEALPRGESAARLPVEFVLATATESTHRGRVETIATRAGTTGEKKSVVEIFASLDAQDLPDRRIGSEVRAKITCGRRSLGYVLFGDVIEFLRKHLWI